MNRLIIIGNGFDLAHGYKTTYNDFIYDCVKSAVLNADYFKPYSNDFVKVDFNERFKVDKNEIISLDNLKDLLVYCSRKSIKLAYENGWYRNLVDKANIFNWTDFETEYYNELISIFQFRNTHAGHNANDLARSKVLALNKSFNTLRSLLIEYLTKISKDIHPDTSSNLYGSYFNGIFNDPVNQNDILIKRGEIDRLESPVDTFYFLSFNYTSTLHFYLSQWQTDSKISFKFNQIHGSLIDENNQVIFGYGDEFDKRYSELEELNDNSYLEHMKSFQYSQNSNYRKLVKFLNQNFFQVYVVGHSCGISDRVMLNRIFESENCRSIKLFYHQINDKENDYKSKRMDISRHFKDKSIVNEIIVPFDKSRPLKPESK